MCGDSSKCHDDSTFGCIYNAGDDRFEIYDLAADPNETINRANEMRDDIPIWQQRLAAWVQYQAKMMQGLLGEEAR